MRNAWSVLGHDKFGTTDVKKKEVTVSENDYDYFWMYYKILVVDTANTIYEVDCNLIIQISDRVPNLKGTAPKP